MPTFRKWADPQEETSKGDEKLVRKAKHLSRTKLQIDGSY